MFNNQQFTRNARNVMVTGFTLMLLSGCTMHSEKLDLTENHNVNDAIDAATGPLQDLNLRRTPIPPLLVQVAANPYGHKPKVTCDDIKTEVSQLDDLLGPDIQISKAALTDGDGNLVQNVKNLDFLDGEAPTAASLVGTAGDLVHDTAIGAIKSQTDFLPFRSIIRRVSGANRHQKRLETAYMAGKLRRAYLKGLAEDRFGDKCLGMKPIVIEAKAEKAATDDSVESAELVLPGSVHR